MLRQLTRATIPAAPLLALGAAAAAQDVEYVIDISVDGLRPDAITQLGPSQLPGFYRMRTEGAFTDNARTDFAHTVTMPNHVCMLTGRPVDGPDGHHVTRNSDPGPGGVPGSVSITNTPGEFVRGAGAVRIDDGSGPNYVDVTHEVFPDQAQAFTIVGWYRFEDVAGNGADIRNFIWETPSDAGGTYACALGLRDGASGRDAEWWFDLEGTGALSDTSGPIVDDGLWHHAALTWNRAAGRARYYHDGQLRDEVAIPAGAQIEDSDGLHIGNHRDGDGTRNWDGFIDDVAVFPFELGPADVASLHSGALSVAQVASGSLTAHWTFDVDYRSEVNDALYHGVPIEVTEITVHTDSLSAGGDPYVHSVFDLVHDHGGRTAFYAGWSGFDFLDRSWNAVHGAADLVPPDDGPDKIDTYHLTTNDDLTAQTNALMADLTSSPYAYTLLHWHLTDSAGHGSGWMSPAYLNAVRATDDELVRLLDFIALHPQMSGRTVVILSADHGGSGTGHGTVTVPEIYTIPFYVWGAGVAAGADLYALNPSTRLDPGTGRPDYDADPQPIRNGDAANLVLDLLDLGTMPGSTIGAEHPLGVGWIYNYCSPVANSTGQEGRICATGSTVVALDDLTLNATQMPLNQFGYFLNSRTQASTFPVPNSQGVLCVGGAIGRYSASVFDTGASGTGSLHLDLANTPTPTGSVAIQPGETWNFTAWYRDLNLVVTSNFTDGVSITFE